MISKKDKANAAFIIFTQSILKGAHWSFADGNILRECADMLLEDSNCEEILALAQAFRKMALMTG